MTPKPSDPPDPLADIAPLLRGNYKTYGTGAVGMIAMVLALSGVIELTQEQVTALATIFVLATQLWQRYATAKAERRAAARAAEATAAAAATLAVVEEIAEPVKVTVKPKPRRRKAPAKPAG